MRQDPEPTRAGWVSSRNDVFRQQQRRGGRVRRYYATVGDLSSTEDDLRPLLSDQLQVTEHPNAVTPQGARRDLETSRTWQDC